MISSRRAFSQHTTIQLKVRIISEGSYDEDNIWIEGTTREGTIAGTFNDMGVKMVSMKEGEALRCTARLTLPTGSLKINDEVVHGGVTYKVTSVSKSMTGTNQYHLQEYSSELFG